MPSLYDEMNDEINKPNVESNVENNVDKNVESNVDENVDKNVETNVENNKKFIADEIFQRLRVQLQIRGKDRKMLTKTFESKELLPFAQLRTLNQKDLLHSLEENDKIGIVIKDQLRVAMINMEQYEQMVNALQEYERLLDCIEEGELFERLNHRLKSERYVEYKEGMSLLEMAGIHPKG